MNSIPAKVAGFLRNHVYNLLPYWLLKKAYNAGTRVMFGKTYREMVAYLEMQEEPEIKGLLPAVREAGKLQAIYGNWTEEYEQTADVVSRDKAAKLFYVHHKCFDGSVKKIYLRSDLSLAACRTYYESILVEQDERSPHCYFTESIKQDLIGRKGGTVLDLGGAEGIFTLECVDYTSRVYCFDADRNWIDPLRKTLSAYSDKVAVIPKYVSDLSDGEYTTVDDFFGDFIPNDIRYIKMDIEGYELQALKGMKRTLEMNPEAVLLVCVYHTPNAESEITEMLASLNYKGTPRPGFVFFWAGQDFVKPYARRGVIEFKKQK